MKICYQPIGVLEQVCSSKSKQAFLSQGIKEYDFEADVARGLNQKTLDISKLCRLSKVPNPKIVQKNLKDLFNHLAKIITGANADANVFKGRNLVIDLKIGKLCVFGQNLEFIPLSLQQVINESKL